jgi:transcriptional regulator with XRE-family HTH domain
MSATASRRQLHRELQRLRVAADLTQTAVARAHEWSPSKVHRIEKGFVSVSRTDLLALLDFYGVTDQGRIDNLLELARLSRNTPMEFAEYKDVFTPEVIRFMGYETSASWIGELQLLFVPGLLQTPEYTRVLINEVHGVSPDKIGKFVASRRERQKILDRPAPPEMSFILDEAVLSRAIGGAETMHEQLAHLRQTAALPHVSIRVIPLASGAHAGLRGPFVYLRFDADGDSDVAYVENRLGDSVFENDPDMTDVYLTVFHDLENRASPPDEFDDYLDRALDRLSRRSSQDPV